MNEWPPSTKPFRASPPDGSVGIVLPIRDGLRFFKLTYHSILAFSDYRYMLTVVDNMSGIQTRQYLESIRKNHQINVLQYQETHNLAAEWNLGIRFMFSFASVKYAICMTPTVIVQPLWLTRMVQAIEIYGRDRMVRSEAIGGNAVGVIGFHRDLYERLDGFDETQDPIQDFTERSQNSCMNARTVSFKFESNTFDPRPDETVGQERQGAAL